MEMSASQLRCFVRAEIANALDAIAADRYGTPDEAFDDLVSRIRRERDHLRLMNSCDSDE